jgi:hypothetical protein
MTEPLLSDEQMRELMHRADSPRTDALIKPDEDDMVVLYNEMLEHSRQLERELAAAKSEREGMVLVPRDPTTGMVCAAVGPITAQQARDAYAAMISAIRNEGQP